MTNLMNETKLQMKETAKKLKEGNFFVDLQGQLEMATILSNQINFYLLIKAKEKQSSEFEILPLYNFLFSESFSSELAIFFSSILISAFADQSLPNVTDFGSFFTKFQQYLSAVIDSKNKDIDMLINYSAKCFSSFFNYNHALFKEALKKFFLPISSTNGVAKYSYFISILQFPTFSSKEEMIEVINLMCNTQFSNANSFILAKFVDWLSRSNQYRSILPSKINEKGEINEILQFLINILLENEESNVPFSEFLKYFDIDISIIPSIALIAEKYLTLSTSNTIFEDFIDFIQKNQRFEFKFNYSAEIFDRLMPLSTEQAFDAARHLTRYSIPHIYDNNILLIINFLKKLTKFCSESEDRENDNDKNKNEKDSTNNLVDFLNSSQNESNKIKYFPFHKVERFCFYLFFREDNPEVRLSAYELLYQISQYFEKINEDWSNYELTSQPFYHQFSNEIGFFIKKNKDKDMEVRDFLGKCDPKEALCRLARRTATNRPEFASKVYQESMTFGRNQNFMINLLMCTLVPILLRYLKNKKVRFDLKSIYQLVKSRNVEALSLIDPSYLIECLKFVKPIQSDCASFTFLTKSALNNVSELKADQIIQEISVLNNFINDYSNVCDISYAILNIISQLEQTKESIDLTLLSSIPSKLANSRNLISEFITVSKFLIERCVNFDILFIEECDAEYFSLAISKYPSKNEEIIEKALHFIPKIVVMHFTKSKSPLEEVAIPFLLSPPKILNDLFPPMFPYLNSSDESSVISAFANIRKLTDFCTNFFNSPFSECVGCRVMNIINIIGSSYWNDDYITNEDKIKFIKIFIDNYEIAPWNIFFTNESDSYFLFKSLVEFGSSPSIIDHIIDECQYITQISEKLLTEKDTYFATEFPNRNSIKSFKKLVFHLIDNSKNNDSFFEYLSKCENINVFKVLIRIHIKNYELFPEILSSNHSLNFIDIAYTFVNEFTRKFAKRNASNTFDPILVRNFFDTCLILIQLGEPKITKVIYNYVVLIHHQFDDPIFVADLIKLVVFDDLFYSLIEKCLVPTDCISCEESSDFLPIDDVVSNEALFWIDIIKGCVNGFNSFNSKYFKYIEKCLEFNSLTLKSKCLEVVSRLVLMPYAEKNDTNLIKFVKFLIFSPTVDPDFSFEFLNSIEEQLGQIPVESNSDITIESFKLDPLEIQKFLSKESPE